MNKKYSLQKKHNLFTLGTITLPKPRILSATIFGTKVNTQTLHSTFHVLKDRLDITFACIRVQELIITYWTLPENHQVRALNLGTTENP
jgi:hypothetical protein